VLTLPNTFAREDHGTYGDLNDRPYGKCSIMGVESVNRAQRWGGSADPKALAFIEWLRRGG